MGLKVGKSPNSYLYVPAAFTGLSLSGGINAMIQTTSSYTNTPSELIGASASADNSSTPCHAVCPSTICSYGMLLHDGIVF